MALTESALGKQSGGRYSRSFPCQRTLGLAAGLKLRAVPQSPGTLSSSKSIAPGRQQRFLLPERDVPVRAQQFFLLVPSVCPPQGRPPQLLARPRAAPTAAARGAPRPTAARAAPSNCAPSPPRRRTGRYHCCCRRGGSQPQHRAFVAPLRNSEVSERTDAEVSI